MAKINVHAGHTKSTGKSPGAVGLLNESVEDRKIVKEIIRLLNKDGYTVYNCTSGGEDERDNLYKIVYKCNQHTVDIDLSFHLDSGRKNKGKADGSIGGCTGFISSGGKAIKKEIAKNVCAEVAKLGFTNRGVKVNNNLYVLNHTKAPAMLFEICFVDDRDDYNLYKKLGYKKIAAAIVKGIENTIK